MSDVQPQHVQPLGDGRLTIRSTVVIGFLAIFALAVVFSYHLHRRLIYVEQRSSIVHARFAESEGLLLTVATQLLLGTVSVRDAFLDTTPESLDFYRRELETARAEIERALQRYLSTVRSSAERDRWAELRTELDAYWDEMLPTLAPDTALNPEEARVFLRAQVVPRRRAIIQIADQIRTLNRDAYARRTRTVGALYGDMRSAAWGAGSIAVLLGLAVALAATRYAGKLESRIREQHLQEAAHTHQLERLSARLVHVQEEERRAIARDVHDEIGQALTAIKIELAVAQRELETAGHSPDSLSDARAMMDGALHAVRDVSRRLHPVTLDTLGLGETLRGYVRSFDERTGIRTELFVADPLDRLSPEVEICVYRVVQEALTNVAKHARAASCRVSLRPRQGLLVVAVEDDGIGIREDEATDGRSHGLGLVGVRERVVAIGGTVSVTGTPGKGTWLRAEIPIREDATDGIAPLDVEAPVQAERKERWR